MANALSPALAQSLPVMDEAHRLVTALRDAAALTDSAAYRRSAGYTFAASAAENGAADTLARLGSPSVARIRAAIILLSGVTEPDLVPVAAAAAVALTAAV